MSVIPFPTITRATTGDLDGIRRLLRYATLAASSHNTQPWRFEVDGGLLRVFADARRQLHVADPDCRELFLSVGCAVENLVVAAAHFGYVTTVTYEEGGGAAGLIPAATVRLDPTPAGATLDLAALFPAIEARHTPHGPFAPLPVPHALVRASLEAAASLDVELSFIGNAATKQAAARLAAEAERVQFARDDFRRELADIVGTGAFGTPRALAWIAKVAVKHVGLGERYAARAQSHVAGAPLLGFLQAAPPTRAALVRAGRAYERIALLATMDGFSVQPVSEPIQVPETRARLAALAGLPAPELVMFFRLGGALRSDARKTPRLRTDDVLVA
jgi:hypothetical protein